MTDDNYEYLVKDHEDQVNVLKGKKEPLRARLRNRIWGIWDWIKFIPFLLAVIIASPLVLALAYLFLPIWIPILILFSAIRYLWVTLGFLQTATYIMGFIKWFMTDHLVFWHGFKELVWVLVPVINVAYVWDWWSIAIMSIYQSYISGFEEIYGWLF